MFKIYLTDINESYILCNIPVPLHDEPLFRFQSDYTGATQVKYDMGTEQKLTVLNKFDMEHTSLLLQKLQIR
jgi:hypothetical protein